MSCGRTRKSPTGQIPNAWSLLSGPNEVPELGLGPERRHLRKPVDRRDDRRHREHDDARREDAELDRNRPDRPAPQKHRGDHRRREEPGGRGQAQHAHDRRTNGCERQDGSSGRARPERPGHEHREQREEPGSGELLDPAPERVAEQDRRLCRDEGGECSHRPQRDERLEQRVQRERQHRGEERDVRLEDPGEVVADEGVPDPDRHQDARRVADPERRRQRRLVGRRREPGEVARVFHHAVGHREVRRGVVELDVAGEGRLARQDDRCREDCEDSDCGAERPQVGTAAPDRPEQQSQRSRARLRAAPPARRSCPSASRTRRRG